MAGEINYNITGVRTRGGTPDEPSTLIEDVSIHLESGEVVGILGPNGCGKSTVLKLLASIGSDFEGSITPTMAAPPKESIAYSPQNVDDALFGWMSSVEQLFPDRIPTEAEILQLRSVLLEAGLYERFTPKKMLQQAMTLSTGEKQILALVRNIVSSSQLLLLDEPVAAIDALETHRLLSILRDTVARQERYCLMALHSVPDALTYCDKVIVLGGATTRILSIIDTSDQSWMSLSSREQLSKVRDLWK